MIYVSLNEENLVIGFYTARIHGQKKCDSIIENGGIMISPQVWNAVRIWHKVKFIGTLGANEYSLSDFEEIKEVVEEVEVPKPPVEILEEKIVTLENENIVLKTQNLEQDEMINISMMATDEIYTMIEPLLEASIQSLTKPLGKLNINTLNEREVKAPMVDMYVAMVQRGLKTIDEIPARYRAQVAEILAALEG